MTQFSGYADATDPLSDAGTRSRPNASAGDDTARVSKRQWAKIVKKPESYTGDKYIYGEVTQFD